MTMLLFSEFMNCPFNNGVFLVNTSMNFSHAVSHTYSFIHLLSHSLSSLARSLSHLLTQSLLTSPLSLQGSIAHSLFLYFFSTHSRAMLISESSPPPTHTHYEALSGCVTGPSASACRRGQAPSRRHPSAALRTRGSRQHVNKAPYLSCSLLIASPTSP